MPKKIDSTITASYDSPTTGKSVSKTGNVSYLEFQDGPDFVNWLTDSRAGNELVENGVLTFDKVRVEELLSAANYGLNLQARAAVRADLQKQLVGPDKDLDKMVRQLISAKKAAGKLITEEKAREAVLAMFGGTTDEEDAAA